MSQNNWELMGSVEFEAQVCTAVVLQAMPVFSLQDSLHPASCTKRSKRMEAFVISVYSAENRPATRTPASKPPSLDVSCLWCRNNFDLKGFFTALPICSEGVFAHPCFLYFTLEIEKGENRNNPYSFTKASKPIFQKAQSSIHDCLSLFIFTAASWASLAER